jgi:hypothetical protein
VPTVVVQEVKHAVPRADTKFVEGRDVWWEDAVRGMPTTAEVEWVEADHPLFLLYTSGSTGGRVGEPGWVASPGAAASEARGPLLCACRLLPRCSGS